MAAPESPVDSSLGTPPPSFPPPSPALEPPPATDSVSFSPPPPSESIPPPSQPPPPDSNFTPTTTQDPPTTDPPPPPTSLLQDPPFDPSKDPNKSAGPPKHPDKFKQKRDDPRNQFEQQQADPPPPPDASFPQPPSTPSEQQQQQQADPPPSPNSSFDQQSNNPPSTPSDQQQQADPPPPPDSSNDQPTANPPPPADSQFTPPADSQSPPTSDTAPLPTPTVPSKDDSSSTQPPSSANSPFSDQSSSSAPRSSTSKSPLSLTHSPPVADHNGWRQLAPPSLQGQTNPAPAVLPLGVMVIVLGGVLILAVFGLCLICCSRKKKKNPYGTEGYYMKQAPSGKDGNRNSQMQHYQHGPPSADTYQMAKLSPRSSMGSRHGNSALHNSNSMNTLNLSLSTTAFSYEELATATNGFSSVNFLGQGGFGYVHKGTLPNGKDVAVKSLKADSGQGDREFQVEIDVISRVHHKHLVCLVGYCVTDNQRMLVYEFIGNGTLEFHLHGNGRTVMDWSSRVKIALGSAKGLAYLHEDCHPKIIHRDIKGANILIDNDFEAKVADFGLAKLTTDNNTHVSTRVMGTFGYLAPEYASTGKLSEKSDVFSFGVMLLELITGRRPVNRKDTEDSLVDWARPLLSKALEDGNFDPLVDPKLGKNYNMREMASMVACAAGAVSHSFKRRPRMSQIVRALDESSSTSDLNGGETPGQTKIFGSPDYTSGQYKDDMKKFREMILDSQASSDHTAGTTTSEYSVSSDSTVEGQTNRKI